MVSSKVVPIGAVVLLLATAPTVFAAVSDSASDNDDNSSRSRRIAIIGGGIGGSFCAKYLTDYDARCHLDVVDVYEPSTIFVDSENTFNKSGASDAHEDKYSGDSGGTSGVSGWQGSRVSSITTSDGTIVELGASIIYDGNKLAVEMLQGDESLSSAKPFFPGEKKSKQEEGKSKLSGFGIYHGNGEWLLNTAAVPSLFRNVALLWRYNIDLLRISKAASTAITSFNLIYELLNSNEQLTYLESIDVIWESVGLRKLSRVSYDEFLDAIGVCREVQWWRSWLPFQGCIRTELLAASTINNYNQEVSRMNGLSGLVSFIPTKGKLFSINGGNRQLMGSALKQASKRRIRACEGKDEKQQVQHISKAVTTVVGDIETAMELFSHEESLGFYDIVILAAPLQHCGIDFFVKSNLDGAVLQPMPMNGLIDSDELDANDHHHTTPPMPSSATRQYTQVVTTVISNGVLQTQYFNLTSDTVPRSIFFSERGRELENSFTVTHLTSDGTFKVFSQSELSNGTLSNMFGPDFKIEIVKVWGGQRGGATPDFDGGGDSSKSTPFLIYDGAKSTVGHGFGPALFYVNSVEASVAAIEISAIGSRAVAKLAAKRLELIAPPEIIRGDEL